MFKKISLFFLILFLVSTVIQASQQKVMIVASFNLVFPADSNFRDTYSSSVILPEIKAGYRISKKIFIWAGFGLLSKDGTTPVLEEEASSSQNFLSLGAGCLKDLSEKLKLSIEAGLCTVFYSEEALGEELSGTAFGFRIDAGLLYHLSKQFFLSLSAGYIFSTDKVEGVSIKPGGVRAGIGLGLFL
jgi:hypothetical protein